MKFTGIEQIASLKINELLIFVELAQVKSVREIARRRKVNPATISRVLVRVEKALDRQLFLRTADGIIPNESGRDLIEKCQQLVNILESLSPGSDSQETLSFGSTSFLSTRFLAPKVEALMKLSKAQVRLLDFPPDELIAAGLKGAFQLALHFERLPWPEATWTSVPLGEVNWGLYCRKEHPIANMKGLKAEDLLKYPFVYPIYWGATEVTIGNDQLPIPIFRRKKAVGTSTADAAYMCLQSSNLLAYLPSLIADEEVLGGQIKLLKVPWVDVKKTLYLTVRSDSLTKRRLESLVDALRLQSGH